jgi:hypothetical protein
MEQYEIDKEKAFIDIKKRGTTAYKKLSSDLKEDMDIVLKVVSQTCSILFLIDISESIIKDNIKVSKILSEFNINKNCDLTDYEHCSKVMLMEILEKLRKNEQVQKILKNVYNYSNTSTRDIIGKDRAIIYKISLHFYENELSNTIVENTDNLLNKKAKIILNVPKF